MIEFIHCTILVLNSRDIISDPELITAKIKQSVFISIPVAFNGIYN